MSKTARIATKSVSFMALYRYASISECLMLVLAVIMAFLKSLAFPIAIVVYSELVAMFIDRGLGIGTSSDTYILPIFGGGKILTNATYEENMSALKSDSISFGIIITLISVLLFVSGFAYVDLFNYVALKQVLRMRRQLFEATVRQDIGWHDLVQGQSFAVRLTESIEKIRNGIAENVGHFIQLMSDFTISVIISFVYGWKLTLAIFIYIPITITINVIVAKRQGKLTIREQEAYSKAGSVAEEAIAGIRTVVAFGGENVEAQRYDDRLVPARIAGKRKGLFTGLSDSVMKSMFFISSAAAFWYGVHLILDDRDKAPADQEYTPAILLIVVTGIIVSADHIAQTSPFLESFALARGSAAPIFDIIDAETRIDPLSKDGLILNYGVKGVIGFEDVFFSYPSRPETTVLRGFNLHVKQGETVALVGHSGCGKSTCLQMVQRFYDPLFGKVTLDGVDVRKYNVSGLRSHIGVVGQEPVLFQGTIGQNIRYGRPQATQKEIEDAARSAGAHDFIIAMPKGYDTHLSEKGVQLSGGQKQRIAIARALIQNPRVLLLDEATSALDYHSEKVVQEALDRASKGRTTLVVSHRLSAIRHADNIVFIDRGRVLEQGSHDELMARDGKYREMVMANEYGHDIEELLKHEETTHAEVEHTVLETLAGDAEVNGKKKNKADNEPRFSDGSIDDAINLAKTKAATVADSSHDDNRKSNVDYGKTFYRVLRSARSEWGYLLVGTICAAIYGCTQPAFAMVFSEFYAAMAQTNGDNILHSTSVVSIISTVVGIVAGVACYTQTYLFNLAGVWLTTRMRSQLFRSILSQDVAWFDEKDNSVGALSARLTSDASSLQGAIGFPLSSIIQATTNFTFSFAIAFSYSWELALICLCTAPFMVASIVFDAKFTTSAAVSEREALEETSRIATEAIAQIRTIASLRREGDVIEEYSKELDRYEKSIRKRLRFRGVVSTLGLAIMFFGYAVTLTYGGIMCANGQIKFENIMKISNSLLYGLFILAQSLAFTPAFNAALVSAHRLFKILDRQSSIQSPDVAAKQQNGAITTAANNTHGVSYRDLYFHYPTRSEKVLRGFNLDVMQGKTVALVGPSGCGKSTCLQLLQRFYDPDAGKISLDQDDIHRDMALAELRRRIGIVSQEPTLFEKTIAENIAYGDNTRSVPITEIMEAARTANAHDFIVALPNGYETNLGSKGTQLSGGQKQRIAIARAILRNPKVLLLDEATSALDLQSERIVQTALDSACSGRTCILIAHRLSTVHNADMICVVKNGSIIEQGNHPQLMAKNGIYAKLYRSQPNT